MDGFFSYRRLLVFLSLSLVTLLGFYTKFYDGPGRQWPNDYGAAIWYEIFWCLFVFALIPKRKAIAPIPLWVFIITCLLEILQLVRTPFFQFVRSHFIGKLLFGTTFSWWDFPHYAIGCFLGWLWLEQIWLKSERKNN